MGPKTYLNKLAKLVSKRSGICIATCEQVIPALFDEIRYQLCEGDCRCVPIESFGTFGVVDIPEREYPYDYKGVKKMRRLPAKKRMKFYSARHMRLEIESSHCDTSRQAFVRHPDDPPIRKLNAMRYRSMKTKVHKGRMRFIADSADTGSSEDA